MLHEILHLHEWTFRWDYHAKLGSGVDSRSGARVCHSCWQSGVILCHVQRTRQQRSSESPLYRNTSSTSFNPLAKQVLIAFTKFGKLNARWAFLVHLPVDFKNLFDPARRTNSLTSDGSFIRIKENIPAWARRGYGVMTRPPGMKLVDHSIENNELFLNEKTVHPWDEAQPKADSAAVRSNSHRRTIQRQSEASYC
jgi:hypothetical protein